MKKDEPEKHRVYSLHMTRNTQPTHHFAVNIHTNSFLAVIPLLSLSKNQSSAESLAPNPYIEGRLNRAKPQNVRLGKLERLKG